MKLFLRTSNGCGGQGRLASFGAAIYGVDGVRALEGSGEAIGLKSYCSWARLGIREGRRVGHLE